MNDTLYICAWRREQSFQLINHIGIASLIQLFNRRKVNDRGDVMAIPENSCNTKDERGRRLSNNNNNNNNNNSSARSSVLSSCGLEPLRLGHPASGHLARLWRHQHVIHHVRVTSTLFPLRRPMFLLVFSKGAVTLLAWMDADSIGFSVCTITVPIQ